jgi:hypothetical protein
VVAICDHLGFFLLRQREHEIRGKTLKVASDLLVEALGRHTEEFGKIGFE